MARTSWVVLPLLACAESGPGDATAGGGGSPHSDPTGADRVRCTYAYRPSNEPTAGQTGEERIFQLEERTLSVGPGEEASELLGQLTFALRYGTDELESDSISLSAVAGEAHVLSILYQLADGLPQNQFLGGHGFTGLLYFTHPLEGGDYQAFCAAVR